MVKDNKYFQPYNVITLCKNLSFFLYWKWDVFFPKIHIKDDLNLSYHKKKQQTNKKQHHNGVCPQQIKNFYGKRKATAIWGKKKTIKTPVLKIFLFNTSQGT